VVNTRPPSPSAPGLAEARLPAIAATAPGKLILAGEYAVLDGAPAVVMAVDRRAIATLDPAPRAGSAAPSPFLAAVAAELLARRGAGDPAARAAPAIAVSSEAFYEGGHKLGLGSSAAVTAAATARALAEAGPLDRAEVAAIALAAHAAAQGPRGARGSGADVAAAVHGGLLAYRRAGSGAWDRDGGGAAEDPPPAVAPLAWPAGLQWIAFFTGASADTAQLVAAVAQARRAQGRAVGAALIAIGEASAALCAALAPHGRADADAALAAFARAAAAMDALAAATAAPLVPPRVAAARAALAPLGAVVKTTGAGGGDLAIAVLPAPAAGPRGAVSPANPGDADGPRTAAARALIKIGCAPLPLRLDEAGVDTRQTPG
jgi:phosphomevalonate kinase